MLRLYSEFLGKRPWFAGDKVKGEEWQGGRGGAATHPGLPDSSTLPLGFLQITFVDFIAYDVLERNQVFEARCLDAFPNLKDFIKRFEVTDALKPCSSLRSSLPHFARKALSPGTEL